MIKKVKLIPILSILISALIFTGSITAIALEPPFEQSEKPLVFSYWRPFNGNDVNVLFGDEGNIIKRLLGGMNNDGRIKAADARLALRASTRLDILDDEDAVVADVNYDGQVTAVDARTILRVSARLQFFNNPFSLRPATINDYLRSKDFSTVTSVRMGDSYDSAPYMKEVDTSIVDYILEVLKNNADAELYFGENSDHIIRRPYFGDMYDQDLYPDKRITCMSDMGFSNISFTIRKGADGSTWIGERSYEDWAAKLENNKDAYDIIVEMANK